MPTGGNLLAGLWKCHPSERGGQSFCIHLTARSLEVIVLPGLCVWGLKKPTMGRVTYVPRGQGQASIHQGTKHRVREGHGQVC